MKYTFQSHLQWEVAEWYEKNRETIQLAESTCYDVETLIKRVT